MAACLTADDQTGPNATENNSEVNDPCSGDSSEKKNTLNTELNGEKVIFGNICVCHQLLCLPAFSVYNLFHFQVNN